MTSVAFPHDGAHPHLSVVVPCYNEEDILPEFHHRIRQALESLSTSWELLYVNDGSTDASAALLAQLSAEPGVRCLNLSRNFGKEAALSAGIDWARGIAVVFIDADLQDPPELVPKMVNLRQAGYDIVNMQRSTRKSDSWLKRTAASLFYRVMRALFDGVRLPVQVSDFRLVGPAPLAALRLLPERGRMLKGLVGWVGFRSIEIPYEREARGGGSSKWSYGALLDLAIDGAVGFSRKPLRWFSLASIAVFLLTLVFVIQELVTGDASIDHLLLALGAFLALGLSLIGEYLGATLMESKSRPRYLVASSLGGGAETDVGAQQSGHRAPRTGGQVERGP